MSLAESFKSARKGAKMSQLALSEAIQVTQGYLSQIETGRLKSIPPNVARRAAIAMRLPHDHFGEFVSRQGQRLSESASTWLVAGVVSAGGGLEEPGSGETVNINSFCRDADGLYRVDGVSMTGAGIMHNDYIAVQKTDTPNDGDLVVVTIEDRGCVVKRARVSTRNGGGIVVVLHCEGEIKKKDDGSADGRYPYTLTDRDTIHGVIVAVFRQYKHSPRLAKVSPAVNRGTKKK